MNNVKMISRGKTLNARMRHEMWATENSFWFNTRELLERTSPLIKRKNQKNMSDNERNQFKNAIQTLIDIGDYGMHASHHTKMNYRMHSMSGPIGTLRFLPWHRTYLFELEEMMQAIEPGIFIPYWNWAIDREIPDWLVNFTPSVEVNGQVRFVNRSPHINPNPPNLPPQEDVEKVMQMTTYESFTQGIESGTSLVNGIEFETGMHNEVHNWVGGIMSNVMYSPTDVLFWLHHANVDRIWSEWQAINKNKNPALSGTDAIMTPWTDLNEEMTRNTVDLGYEYVI